MGPMRASEKIVMCTLSGAVLLWVSSVLGMGNGMKLVGRARFVLHHLFTVMATHSTLCFPQALPTTYLPTNQMAGPGRQAWDTSCGDGHDGPVHPAAHRRADLEGLPRLLLRMGHALLVCK